MPTWIGRDEIGRVIDIHADEEAHVAPPGPEELATSSVQTVMLLGPYTVAFDAAGLFPPGNGVVVGDALAVGTLVLRMYVLPMGTWGVEGVMTLGLGDIADGLGIELITYDLGEIAGPANREPQGLDVYDAAAMPRIAVVQAESWDRLVVAVYPDAGNPAAGSVDVYALVATPTA